MSKTDRPVPHNGPARGYSWPPFEKGNQASVTHGLVGIVDHHPALIRPETLEGIEQHRLALIEEYPFLHESDANQLRQFARLEYEIEHLADYGDRVKAGEARVILRGVPKGTPNTGVEAWYASGLYKELSTAIKHASEIARNLGLNPAGRYAIAKDLYTAHRLASAQGVRDLVKRGRRMLDGDAS